jgi:hypothetical protein
MPNPDSAGGKIMDSNNTKSERQSALSVGIESATAATEKVLKAWFGFCRDARGEVVERALGLVDWLDTREQSASKRVRSAVQRTDEVVSTWLDSSERLALRRVQTLRPTDDGTRESASTTAAAPNGRSQETPMAQP